MQLFQKYSFYTRNNTLFRSKNQNTLENLHMKAWLLSRQNVSSVLNPYHSEGLFLSIKEPFKKKGKTCFLNLLGAFIRYMYIQFIAEKYIIWMTLILS